MQCIILFFVALLSIVQTHSQSKWKPGVLGYKNNNPAHSRPKTRGNNGLPSQFSIKEYAPPVGNQDTFGTCVGWATTYACLTMMENIELERKGKDLKMNDCFSPQLTYDICKFSYDKECSEGLFILNALNTLKDIGATRLSNYPYLCSNNTARFGIQRIYKDSADEDEVTDLLTNIKSARLRSFIPIGGPNIVENVKYYLTQKRPVVIGVEMYNSIANNTVSNVWTGVMDYFPGGHAMCVVGYDDKKEGGAFEIMNSWGNDWADSGFVWFRYADFAKVVDEAYALTGIKLNNNSQNAINNFDLTVSAVGAQASKLLTIKENSTEPDNFATKKGALISGFTIEHPKTEKGFRLNITNNGSESFNVYGFLFNNGYISMITTITDTYTPSLEKDKGMIIPSEQITSIPFPEPFERESKICILVSKLKIEAATINEAVSKKYSSLENFMETSFGPALSLNKSTNEGDYSGKMRIFNPFEMNEMMPLFFSFQEEEEEEKNLFDEVIFNKTIDFPMRLEIENILDNFQMISRGDRMKLNIRMEKIKTTMKFTVSCKNINQYDFYIEDIPVEETDEASTPSMKKNISLYNKAQKSPDLFRFSFNSTKKNYLNLLKKQITDKLISKDIKFTLTNL